MKGAIKIIRTIIKEAFKKRETVEDYYRIEYGIQPERKKFEDYRFPHV